MFDDIKYFECHLTIDPVFDEKLEELKTISRDYGFTVADLILRKSLKDPEQSHKDDSFLTARSKDQMDLEDDAAMLMLVLEKHGYTVRRLKIEACIYDKRF